MHKASKSRELSIEKQETVELLLQAKVTQVEMVRDRGYELPKFEQSLLDERDFESQLELFFRHYHKRSKRKGLPFYQALSWLYRKRDTRELWVDFASNEHEPTVKQATALHFYKGVLSQESDGILITQAPLAEEHYTRFRACQYNLWHFRYNDLFYNPTQHALVSPHRLLEPVEAQRLCQLLFGPSGCTLTLAERLPKIKLNDPVVRYYGWQLGSLVAVERRVTEVNLIAQARLYYRVIVE